ncbi:MAG TPA: hypothetical protein VIT42_16305 [Microlunatus sp.]
MPVGPGRPTYQWRQRLAAGRPDGSSDLHQRYVELLARLQDQRVEGTGIAGAVIGFPAGGVPDEIVDGFWSTWST